MATVASGTLTANGASAPFVVVGAFNITRWSTGTVAAEIVVLERSFDDGATWHPMFAGHDMAGTGTTNLVEGTTPMFEREAGMLFRVRASAMAASGQTVGWRVGQ